MRRCKYCRGSGKSIVVIEMPSIAGLKNINKFVLCQKCYGKGVK